MIFLVPFLERDLLSSLPYIAASSLTAFPVEMHKDIMNYLIYHILPFSVRKYFRINFHKSPLYQMTSKNFYLASKSSEDSYIALSVPSVLMAVLQYSEEMCQSSNVNGMPTFTQCLLFSTFNNDFSFFSSSLSFTRMLNVTEAERS